jgi:hypothetical protein
VISIVAGCLANHDRAHSPETLMGDGLLTIRPTLLKQKRNSINTHYRHRHKYQCLQTGM